jgi:cell fate (sporulation/competence/biofilm development) regulator YmcA (YheA/YmcA/DUF963 family)
MRQLNAELSAAEGEELKGAMDDIKALQRQVTQLRDEIKSSAMKPVEEGRAAVKESRQAIDNTTRMLQKPLTITDEREKPATENKIALPMPDPDQSLSNLVNVPDNPE